MLWILFAVGILVTFFAGEYATKQTKTVRIIGIFLTVIGLGGIGILGMNYQYETIQTNKYKIVELQDSSQISGHGSLAYISISTDEVYTFYYESDGGYKRGKVDAKNTVIYEDDDCTPVIIEYTEKKITTMDKNIISFLGGSEHFFEDDWSWKTSYEIFVPENSIVRQFNLDSQ